MKNKILSLLLLSTILVGCSLSSNKEYTLVLNAGFVFNHIQTQEGEELAKLLLNDAYYVFSSEIKLDKPLVAGDQLSISFDGQYEAICRETYPAQCTVTGTIKNYSIIETQIRGIHVDDTTIANAIKNGGFVLDNEYVILDEEGRYTSLNDYNGSDIFLSYNQKKMVEYCTCPKGAQCQPCPIYVAGLYAYNPRSN